MDGRRLDQMTIGARAGEEVPHRFRGYSVSERVFRNGSISSIGRLSLVTTLIEHRVPLLNCCFGDFFEDHS